MIDTLRLESKPVSEFFVTKINEFMISRKCEHIKTGKIIYEFTCAELNGSFDNRIMIQIRRFYYEKTFSNKLKKRSCDPYLVIEFSANKMFEGHNLYGGSDNLEFCIKHFNNTVEFLTGLKFPEWSEYNVVRIDYAKNYYLGLENSLRIIKFMNGAEYSRRKVNRYGNHSIHIPGSTTTLKIYHKGTEFNIHDKNKLIRVYSPEEIFSLKKLADDLLRVEISIKRKKLEYDFGMNYNTCEIREKYLSELFDKEVLKLMNESKDGRRNFLNVESMKFYLQEKYGDIKGGSLFLFWQVNVTEGIQGGKKFYSRAEWYRMKKILSENDISLSKMNFKFQSLGLPNLNFYSDDEFVLENAEKTGKVLNFRVREVV